MRYQTQLQELGRGLREARSAKGWSQRRLSAQSGVTQANISKIENGQVDLQVSSLMELARFLDLELTLAPRQATPAIEAIIRETSAARVPAQVARDVERINTAALDMADRLEGPLAEAPASLRDTVQRVLDASHFLRLSGTSYAAPFAARELSRIANQVTAAQKLLTPTVKAQIDFVRRNPKTIEEAQKRLAEATRSLAVLRNTVVHQTTDEQRPAYVLDDDETM